MGDKTKIAWCNATMNALRGCQKVSAGCDNCYAMTLAARFSGVKLPYEGLAYRDEDGAHWTGEVKFVPEKLELPLRWTEPRLIFTNSVSDLFYARVLRSWVDMHWATFALAPQHQFQVLTKRPDRMARYLSDPEMPGRVAAQMQQLYLEGHRKGRNWTKGMTAQLDTAKLWAGPLPNVWLGTSVEEQAVVGRVVDLMACPAAIRFISAEPLIGPLDLDFHLRVEDGIHWVIVGGESGANHRPMEAQWARDIRDSCARNTTAFFFKQSGGFRPGTGEELDGLTHHEYPIYAS